MSLKRKFHQNASVIKIQMLPKSKCHQNANVTKMQMSQITNVTKTQMSPKRKKIPKPKCHRNTNVTNRPMSPKRECHQNSNSPLELPFVFLYLPNGSGKTRSPDEVHINPNGLPGHGLSDSRLVLNAAWRHDDQDRYL